VKGHIHLLQPKFIPGNYEPAERDLPEEFGSNPLPERRFVLL
jgi:hypothetical protein